MAHNHECRRCEKFFVCGEDASECFRRFITCNDCFRRYDLRYFLLVFVLAVVAIAMTLYLSGAYFKPVSEVLR